MSTQSDSFDMSRLGAFVQSPLLGRDAVPAEILVYPTNQTVNQGQTTTFTVTAAGMSPLYKPCEPADQPQARCVHAGHFPGTIPNSTISNAVLTFKPNFLIADEAFDVEVYWIDTSLHGESRPQQAAVHYRLCLPICLHRSRTPASF